MPTAQVRSQPSPQPATSEPPRAVRRVGLCVDDFGLHDGVTEAVRRLMGLSRVAAVGCLVDGPAFAAAANSILGAGTADGDDMAVGLHLDLTEGYTRMARPLGTLIALACLRRLSVPALEREIHRQLDLFETVTGRTPDFVDGHQHVHQLPQVREALLGILDARYAGRLPWLRCTIAPARLRDARFKAAVIARLGGAALRRSASRGGFAQNGHLLGVYDFEGVPGGYGALVRRWLEASVDGDLLMCHPSAHTTSADPLLSARLRELHWLTSREFGRMLAELDVRLELAVRPVQSVR